MSGLTSRSLIATAGFWLCATGAIADSPYARSGDQAVDAWYTAQIAKYTTDPSFNSKLTDYLPASATVPTPAKILGDVAGAPNYLPYSKDVYRYFRALADSSPRVRVLTIGSSEEGREMIAVAIADESLLDGLKDNDSRLAKLADPRTIAMDDATAAQLVAQTTPVYYITGTIHSTETGAPTALMELAYRLAVDDAPYIQKIRSHVITLITPIVEVDGRDRMVDLYNWHLAHAGQDYPPLMYWGHYVAHDNNRDAMTLTLNLTRNVLDTYVNWHAQVLHDLHESVPFLYDNTVGDGPYNAWIDPILTGEWQQLGWNNVSEMGKLGMPGVFTHGDFDTWSPGYLMFIAAMHNGISRLYETFGNDGADTLERILDPGDYERTWYRPNPPLPKVIWSQRDNNNYEQTGLLTALNFFADNSKLFLQNFYLKSKNSILKPTNAGPAAYVFPADDGHRVAQAELLRLLQAQHCEIQRTLSPISVVAAQHSAPIESVVHDPIPDKAGAATDPAPPAKGTDVRSLPAGTYVVRMDQPYSRIADALLDRQYWAPDDPQKHPYDDTGWSMGDLFGVRVMRVTDLKILGADEQAVVEPVRAEGGLQGSGKFVVVDASSADTLIGLRYRLRNAKFDIAEGPFDVGDQHFSAGALILSDADAEPLTAALTDAGLMGHAFSVLPSVPMHPLAAPRIAVMHTWLDTQTEGWWRMALDKLKVPYSYISTQDLSRKNDWRERFDVILFAPVGVRHSRMILDGLPMSANPMPWKTTKLTPNLGAIDATDDIRPGLGAIGLQHLKQFVDTGGLLITAGDTSQFAIDEGLAPGVFVSPEKNLRVVGSVLRAVLVDPTSPITYGLDDPLAIYSADGLSFEISNQTIGDSRLPSETNYHRVTGRGGPNDIDQPEGRPPAEPPELPTAKPWEALPINAEQARNNPFLIPPAGRPRTILRFSGADTLLVSGLLDGASNLSERAVLVQASSGKGHVLLFANNPIWRGETIGSYPLVFNAILNFDHLGPPAQSKQARQ